MHLPSLLTTTILLTVSSVSCLSICYRIQGQITYTSPQRSQGDAKFTLSHNATGTFEPSCNFQRYPRKWIRTPGQPEEFKGPCDGGAGSVRLAADGSWTEFTPGLKGLPKKKFDVFYQNSAGGVVPVTTGLLGQWCTVLGPEPGHGTP